MSHEVETMMYAGETPWHRLGKQVAGLQTAEEAIIAAGLDWDVELRKIAVEYQGGWAEISDNFAVTRVTDAKTYGIVGDRYTPIQNRQAFKFFDNVIGTGQAVYETAGSLFEGRRIFILANLNGTLDVNGDEIKSYLLLVQSHDGSLALQMFWTKIRVVCRNTMEMAFATGLNRFYARHTAGATQRIEAAQEILGLAVRHDKDWLEQAQALARLQLPSPEVPKLLAASFGLKKADDIINLAPVMRNQMEKAKELIYVGKGQDNPKIQGTAWQAYSGIAEFADYHKNYRGGTEDNRVSGMFFGSGAAIKARAWDYLLKKVR